MYKVGHCDCDISQCISCILLIFTYPATIFWKKKKDLLKLYLINAQLSFWVWRHSITQHQPQILWLLSWRDKVQGRSWDETEIREAFRVEAVFRWQGHAALMCTFFGGCAPATLFHRAPSTFGNATYKGLPACCYREPEMMDRKARHLSPRRQCWGERTHQLLLILMLFLWDYGIKLQAFKTSPPSPCFFHWFLIFL